MFIRHSRYIPPLISIPLNRSVTLSGSDIGIAEDLELLMVVCNQHGLDKIVHRMTSEVRGHIPDPQFPRRSTVIYMLRRNRRERFYYMFPKLQMFGKNEFVHRGCEL